MGLWILSLITTIVIPTAIAVIGIVLEKRIPKRGNGYAGYRTIMSMKNDDTWEFANHYFGKVCKTVGPVMFILALATMIFAFGKGDNTVKDFTSVIVTIEILALFISIVITEIALSKNFDENGRRK